MLFAYIAYIAYMHIIAYLHIYCLFTLTNGLPDNLQEIISVDLCSSASRRNKTSGLSSKPQFCNLA